MMFKHLLALSLWVVFTGGCERPSDNPKEHSPDQPVPVTTTLVERATLEVHTTVSGTLAAKRRVEIANQTEGQIVELPVYEGSLVEKNTIVLTLDDDVIRAELVKASAERRQAELDLTRMATLFNKNAASDDEVAQARTALDLARAEEHLQDTLLARTRVKAPFSGIVSERLKEPGDTLQKYTHVLTIIDPDPLVIDAHVSELLLSGLQQGDAVQIQIDALDAARFSGHISRVHPVIDPETRQGTVEIQINAVPPGALPGQLVRITLTSHKIDGLVLPFASVRRDREGTYVFRLNDDSVQRTAINLGDQVNDRIQIIDGLEEGDRVIASGLVNLHDGTKVYVVDEKATSPSQPVSAGSL